MRLKLVFLFVLGLMFNGTCQEVGALESDAEFRAASGQKYGFDPSRHNIEPYIKQDLLLKGEKSLPIKSVAQGESDLVYVHLSKKIKTSLDQLKIRSSDDGKEIPFVRMNDSTLMLFLAAKIKDYDVVVRLNRVELATLRVKVFTHKKLRIKLVPLVPFHANTKEIEAELNAIYKQANVKWEVEVEKRFRLSDSPIPKRFANPDPTYARYTAEMQGIRDDYFEGHPAADRHTYYVFVIPGFINSALKGYQPLSKAVGFLALQEGKKFSRELARQLGRGQGMLNDFWLASGTIKGETSNLMDASEGIELTAWQWTMLRHGSNSYAYFDDYEDVVSTSGRVAAVFWEENTQGYILLKGKSPLRALKRPFKRNYMSYELHITSDLYKYLFSVLGIQIAWIHLLLFLCLAVIYLVVHRAFFRWKSKHQLPFRFLDLFLGAIAITVFLGLNILSFISINQTYNQFLIKNGRIPSYKGKNKSQVIDLARENRRMKNTPEYTAVSEVFIKRKSHWHLKKLKPVLYFEHYPDMGQNGALKFLFSSNRLILPDQGINKKVFGHFIVIKERSQTNNKVTFRLYNHVGIELTSKVNLPDPPKRILLFINGYRATTRGHDFEAFFGDIFKFGLEHPNSENLIYSFDRFDYWRPWEQIDLLFQQRINPSDTYYADGHFSVTTSNHRTLFNFTTTAGLYPRRCLNAQKHSCFQTTVSTTKFIGNKKKSTYDLHPMQPNKAGFRERMNNGKLAGFNLYQQFNELPNGSKNDTLFIVAHSMGYAYALGIIEHLRGSINFGGFYIIAPENASSGSIRMDEWQEVWQYGSNLEHKNAAEPCLQDGIAPQVKCGGLQPNHRVFFPRHLYRKQGFFDAHFIGYYTWIFEIPKNSKGYVRQR